MPKILQKSQLLTDGPKKVVLQNQYSIDKHIGSGAFSDIYLVRRLRDREMFAMKAEWHKRTWPQIEHEKQVYEELKGHTAIATIHYFNTLNEHRCLVMDYLGPSLEDLLERCGGTFQLKTVLMIAAQMLGIIEYVHAKGFIHRDLKPANFCLRRYSEQQLVLIDFGLAQRYPRDENGNGSSEVDGGFKFWHPTSSVRAHMGFPQDRSDDLEAIGYTLIYFLYGFLPWHNYPNLNNSGEEQAKLTKLSTSLKQLCGGLPKQFEAYMTCCRSLEAGLRRVDYAYLKILFFGLLCHMNYENDGIYDWMLLEKRNVVAA
ncbi:protein kinase domain-containing protein [Ditylenchus destructor]|uniref:non-specific serine/threonine protein kinase n=1 Tax=Ditylenchus destructor TaxID=166010 RepID=A0AAD4MR19_9BILA|nr:protein kinase domain-containing protein [Ditylenchus destructor]